MRSRMIKLHILLRPQHFFDMANPPFTYRILTSCCGVGAWGFGKQEYQC
ncbi:hypothetical protein [Thermobrachium celere]|nr:hypothetical protein [Thermobrachium celere]